MAGPWEKYRAAPAGAPAAAGPWQKYGGAQPPADLPWYGEEKGIAAKLMDAGTSLVTGIDDVMSGRVDPKSDQGIANITNAALVASPVSAATRGGLGWAGAARTAQKKVPTAVELKKAGDFGYDLARQMGVDYDARAVQNLMLRTRSDLYTDGVIEELAPKSFAFLKKLESPPEGGIATLSGLDAARRGLGKVAQEVGPDGKPTADALAATRIIKSIDGFVENPDPQSVVAGPAAAAANVQKDARGNIAAQKRSDRLTGVEERAEGRAAATNSGLNLDNAIRTRVDAILQDAKRRSGFSKEEIELLETVRDGTAARNVIRFIGNLLGGGGGLGAALTGLGSGLAVGSSIPALVGGAVVGTGVATKVLANRQTKGALRKADEAVRSRSPLYQNAPTAAAPPAGQMLAPRAAGGVATTPQSMTPAQVDEYLRQKRLFEQGA